MNRDIHIDLSIKMAFEKICNVDNKVAKALVWFLDEMFRSTANEEEVSDKVGRVV